MLDRVVAGYFPEWGIYARGFQVTNIAAPLLTHVIYAFLKPRYDPTNDVARLEFHDRYAAVERSSPGDTAGLSFGGNLRQLIRLKERYPHLRTLISVGGATLSDDFSDLSASPAGRRTFAESCVDHLRTYDLDGVDLDWEFPVTGGEAGLRHRAEDRGNLVLLVKELRGALDALGGATGRQYALTVATSVGGSTLTDRYDLPALVPWVDWLNVMAYRMVGAWSAQTGHQAPLRRGVGAPAEALDIVTCMNHYLSLGVPANKLVLGLPFYGLGFREVAGVDQGLYQPHRGLCAEGSWTPGEFDFRDLRDGVRGHPYLTESGFTEAWDASSVGSTLYHREQRVFITYESPASAALKAEYVRTSGLRGVMYWSLDADTADAALQRAVQGQFSGAASGPAAPEQLRKGW